MIESTAIARINRASRTVTTTPGDILDYKPGELVDYHRPQASKDSSGWQGPEKVIENLPKRGQVRIATDSGEIRCAYKDVRRFLEYSVLLFGIHTKPGSSPHAVVGIIEQCLSQMETNKLQRLGYVQDSGVWKLTTNTRNAVQLMCALEHFVSNVVHYPNVVAVRIGRGISRFPKDTSAEKFVLLWWNRDIENLRTFESDGNGPISTYSLVGPEWARMNYVQLMISTVAGLQLSDILDDDGQLVDDASDRSTGADASGRSDLSDPERLCTIEEGDEDASSDYLVKPEWCTEDDWSQCTVEEQRLFVTIELDADIDFVGLENIESARQLPTGTGEIIEAGLHYLTFGADSASLNQTNEADESGNAYVEILFLGDSAKLILDEPPPDGATARLRVYLAPLKTAIVERDTDLLTDPEYVKYAQEVRAAILEELRIWIDHKCFTRRPRKGARNVLDVRWVGKWKWVKTKTDASKKVRIIRMRMTLRGFKDRDAADLITFAGTSSRVSQRIVVSEACCRGWPLAAIDVRKAFLKGITYAELAATTNEPAREVNFELSPDAAAILRQCPGFEDFDPAQEVLNCPKPGTGCKDAPRCFGIKFSRATNDEFGAKPTTHDEQFIVRHTNHKLDFLGAKHVDDVKAGCPPAVLQEFIARLEQVFGKGELDITLHNFTCCGVRHTLTDKSYEMDQMEYIAALKTIENKEMVGKANDQPADAYNAQLFLSLLMALAFCLLTRNDLGAYVVAMQRVAQSPKYLHIRRLNTLVRWAQKNPLKLVYWFMTCSKRLVCDSDTGFLREVDEEGNTDGRAARGANYMRVGVSNG